MFIYKYTGNTLQYGLISSS